MSVELLASWKETLCSFLEAVSPFQPFLLTPQLSSPQTAAAHSSQIRICSPSGLLTIWSHTPRDQVQSERVSPRLRFCGPTSYLIPQRALIKDV